MGAFALIILALALRFFRRDPKVAGPVSIGVGVLLVFAVGLLLRERIRRDGARGWWALLGTIGIPAALMGHVLYWGTHFVPEPRYPLAVGLAVGGTLAIAFGFRRSHNPRLSRVLGGLGAISLAAKLIVMRPMVPIGTGPDDIQWLEAPWAHPGILVPALGALLVLAVIVRPTVVPEKPAAF